MGKSFKDYEHEGSAGETQLSSRDPSDIPQTSLQFISVSTLSG